MSAFVSLTVQGADVKNLCSDLYSFTCPPMLYT